MFKDGLLLDRKVLITGGSRGLGQAFCEEFAKQGADVAFTFSKDLKGAEETEKLIRKQGRRSLKFQTSVLDEIGISKMISWIDNAWNGVDSLVNNAGVSEVMPLALMTAEDWDQVLDVNVKGTFLMTKSVLRGMIGRRSGRILNISSLAGVRLITAPIHYSTSKAAIKGFTESLSKEIARYGIRVNCLAPGLLQEGVAQNLPEDRVAEFLEQVSLGRRGTLQEISHLAAFIISDLNSYMNGTTILADGGL